MVKYAYEYGKRWNVKTPRQSIARHVDSLHVGTALPDIITLIEQTLANVGPEFTPSIRKQCVVYAMLRHTANQELYVRVMKGV